MKSRIQKRAKTGIKRTAFLLAVSFALGTEGADYASEPIKQTAFTACKVELSPGVKYATAGRTWQGCPTICITKGGTLYAGWLTGGDNEAAPVTYNVLTRSRDGGFTWTSEPFLVIDSLPEKKIQTMDGQLWVDPDGKLWYFWQQVDRNPGAKQMLSVWAIVCDDPDAEKLSWSKPSFITPGFLRNQPTVLKDGRWILCAYDGIDKHYRYTESRDKGKTWSRKIGGERYPSENCDETMLVEQKDGKLSMLARCARNVGKLAESVSADGGKTWTKATLTEIPNPASRFVIKRLRSGRLLLVNNWDSKERINLCAALSEDDGKTWKYRLVLDSRVCSYPDAVQGKDGEIYIIYDNMRHSHKEILICRITEEDIIKGPTWLHNNTKYNLLSPDSYLGQIVNKGRQYPVLTDAGK